LRGLFDTGLIFLLVGAVLGKPGIGFIDDRVLKQTGPISVICMGWIGFLFGVHLELRRLRRIARIMWVVSLGQATWTFLLIFAAVYLFFSMNPGVASDSSAALAGAVVLAACGAGSSAQAVFGLHDRPGFAGETGQAMRIIASIDDIPGLVIFGLFFAAYPLAGVRNFSLPGAATWIFTTIGIGVLFGFLLKALAMNAKNEQSTFLIVMGSIGLSSGAAIFIHVSPLFIGAVAGFTLANISSQKEQIYKVLAASEHTIYVVFLLLIGSQWSTEASYIPLLATMYIGARVVGKVTGAMMGHTAMNAPSRRLRLGGLGLLGQSAMAIVMAADYVRDYRSSVSGAVMTALIIGVIVNEIVHPLASNIPFGKPKTERRLMR